MSKAKIASSQRSPNVVVKNDHDGYMRFGYRLPHGLVVTSKTPIADIGQPAGADPVLLPISFLDYVPVVIHESINWNHLTDVVIFSVSERAKMLFDQNEQLAKQYDEVVALSNAEATDQAAYDSKWDALTYEADTKLPNQLPDEDAIQHLETKSAIEQGFLPGDEECTCDQCENKVTGFEPRDEDDFSQPCGNCDSNECSGCKDSDYNTEIGAYLPDPGDENE